MPNLLSPNTTSVTEPHGILNPIVQECSTFTMTSQNALSILQWYDDKSIQRILFKNKINEAFLQLDDYYSYPENWDGYFGKTFEVSLINYFKFILSKIESFETIFIIDEITANPLSDGAISLELTSGNNELTIKKYDNDQFVECFFYDGTQGETKNFPASSSFLETELKRLCYSDNI